jgi:hypothetical protein
VHGIDGAARNVVGIDAYRGAGPALIVEGSAVF